VPVKQSQALVRHVVQEKRSDRWWCGVLRRDDGADHQVLVVPAVSFFDAQEKLVAAFAPIAPTAVSGEHVYVFPIAEKIARKLPRG
jgi:hypothetical protein